ncbi:hypothetical protein KTT_60250 [Tengunoibacter tsumagoiensis]|uniref:HAMP domain-containing protein n=1 Tax=Tengunoibacter tsumagoiensis TaxID=2014871 RepID=A0A402AAU6_9CHLR|nr:hypothetical protein KTT_60250 [Tengunoibacter tsumagoiensis]
MWAVKWWYQFTTPMSSDREIERKTRIFSLVVFLLLLDNIFYAASGILSGSIYLLSVLGIETVLTVVAIFFNRRSKVLLAGIIVTLTYTSGIMASIIPVQHISTGVFPLFALLIIPELLAAALLPALSILALAVLNSIFMLAIIELKPAVAGFTSFAVFSYFFILVSVLLLAAGISFVLVDGLQTALAQRNRAEEIAELERQLAIVAEAKAREKQQLDYSIQLINDAQARFANGEMDIRVPLTSNNVLWPVAGALNNLFVRLQRQQELQQNNERVIKAITNLHTIIQNQNQGPAYHPSGTIVDQLAMALLPPHMFEQDKVHRDKVHIEHKKARRI